MPRVVHFEIHASQPQLLIDYYTALFGWKIERWGPIEYWTIETGPADQPGINGGLVPRQGAAPSAMQPVGAFVCTVEVTVLDESVDRAVALGGSLALPKMPIPSVGWLAYIKDPDGNILGLMQTDPKAAL
jgi:predicted enzyme related to lactoylglutathione lyase